MRAGKKNLQSSRLPRISRKSEGIPRYLANTRVSGNEVWIARMGSYPWGFTGGTGL